MTGFAGSQHSAERRRRRLAVEQDGALDRLLAAHKEVRDGDEEDEKVAAVSLISLPIQSMIPRAIWMHVGAGVLLAVLLFGGRIAVEVLPRYYGVDTSMVRGAVVESQQVLAGLCLFATLQLCVVIRQLRGRSLNDFDGRYRIWNWAIAAAGLLTAAVFLQGQIPLGEILVESLKLADAATAAALWQGPLLAMAGVLFLALRREMRDSRLANVAWHLSMLCYFSDFVLTTEVSVRWPEIVPAPVLEMPLSSILFLAGHVLLFMAMSLHARYVVHCNPEPATSAIKPFRIRIRLPRMRVRRLRLPRLRLPKLKLPVLRLPKLKRPKLKLPAVRLKLPKRKPKVAAPQTEAVVAEPTMVRQPKVVEPAKKTVAKNEPAPPRRQRIEPAHTAPPEPEPVMFEAVEEEPWTEPEPYQERRQKTKGRASQRQIEEEVSDVTADELKGLSKKQRRQLRKQRRDAQRAASE